MAFTLTTADKVLKVFYLPKINEQLNQQSILYDRLKKYQETVDGKNYTYALHTGRNIAAGIGIADGGQFGTAGSQGYKQAIVPDTQIQTPIEVTGRTIKATKTDAGAFVRAIRSEVDGAQTDSIRAINRQLHSDGTDALAFWTGADDTSGTAVDDGQGNAFVHLDLTSAETLDLVDAGDNTTLHGTAIVVTLGAEEAADFLVTWTGTVSGSADGDYLVKSGSLGLQLMGIRGVISASDPPLLTLGLHGLAVATNNFWKAASFANSGTKRDLTLELMQKPLTRIAVTSGFTEADVKFMLCNGAVRDKYVSLLVAEKRFVNAMELDGGFSAVDFNGKPLVVDPQCRHNVIYYITPKTMDILTSSNGLVWADFEDGQMWQKKPASGSYYDAYQAFLVFYGNLACKARNGNGILADINE